MTPESIAAFLAVARALGDLSPFAIAVGIIWVLYKGLYISKAAADGMVASEVAKTAAVLAVEQQKNVILERELERREKIYIATMAEIRTQLAEAHKVREKVQAELAESTKVLYKFTDVLTDLRDQAKPR